MGRNGFDYNFDSAYKPCISGYILNGNGREREVYECPGRGRCVWYRMCDFEWKDPQKPPTLEKSGRLIF